MSRFHVMNFGCRANQADGDSIEKQLAQSGCELHRDPNGADIVVLNSCTVTSGADYSLRNAARRIRRENPSARIIVTGCYAQRSPADVAAIHGVDAVVGNSHKSEIARIALDSFVGSTTNIAPPVPAGGGFVPLGSLVRQSRPKILHSDIFIQTEFLSYHTGIPDESLIVEAATHDRTRPNLKVQDGCNNRCSFCIIPSVRGQSRSLPLNEVVRSVSELCAAGYKEIVISGINLGQYGQDFIEGTSGAKKPRLLNLIRKILDETPLERLRLSSVEPMDFGDELLELMAGTPRIALHIHAPLQSGSDRILRLMHRKYRAVHYRERIQAAHRLMPNAAFGADVMVGFPGETAEDFEETRGLIEDLPFTYLHVFPYSRRPGTPADRLPNQVHGKVVRERTRALRNLSSEKNAQFRKRQVGMILDVVTLDGGGSDAKTASTPSLSSNYLPATIEGARIAPRNRLPVFITGVSDDGLLGRPFQPATSN